MARRSIKLRGKKYEERIAAKKRARSMEAQEAEKRMRAYPRYTTDALMQADNDTVCRIAVAHGIVPYGLTRDKVVGMMMAAQVRVRTEGET